MKRSNEPLYAVSIFCSAVSLILFPVIFGPIAFIMAIIIICKGENKWGLWALLLSIVLPIIASIISVDSFLHGGGNNFELAMGLAFTNVVINLIVFFFMADIDEDK